MGSRITVLVSSWWKEGKEERGESGERFGSWFFLPSFRLVPIDNEEEEEEVEVVGATGSLVHFF